MQNSTGTQDGACAVCKYQRRKCTSNCILAPFFPSNRQKDFLNTRKLFGVRNIVKLIENLNAQQRVVAMKTIIFEANVRASDPVGGCYKYICELNKQNDRLKAELNLVNQQLAVCKAQSMFTQYQEPSEEQVNGCVSGQNLEGFTIFDGGVSSSSLWSAYDVFDFNPTKAEPNMGKDDTKQLYVDNNIDESLDFDPVRGDIKPLLPSSFRFCFDPGTAGSKTQKSVSKEKAGRSLSSQVEVEHDLELDGGVAAAASVFKRRNGKEIIDMYR